MSAIRRNLALGALSAGISGLGGVLMLPVFLQAWGAEGYGQWVAISSVPSALALAELGMNAAFANAFVIARESGRREGAARLAATVWQAEIAVFAVGITILWLASASFPLAAWIGIADEAAPRFTACIVLLGLYSGLSVLAGFFAACYRAAERNATYLAETSLFRLLEFLAVAATLSLGSGFAGVALAMACVKGSQVVWMAWRALRLVPEIRLFGAPLSVSALAGVLPSGIALSGHSVSSALANQGAVLAVQHVLGPTAVAQVSVARQFGRLAYHAISLVFASVHPEMNLAFARGDRLRMARLQSQALFPVIWFSLPAIVCAALFGPTLVSAWTGSSVRLPPSLCAVFMADSWSYGLSTTALLAAWGSNRLAFASLMFVIVNALALAAGASLLAIAGAGAIGVSFVVANGLLAVVSTRVTARILGCSGLSIWRAALFADPWGALGNPCPGR